MGRGLRPRGDLCRVRGELVGVVDARGAEPWGPLLRVEPVARGREPLRQRGRHRQLRVHLRPDRLERRPEALLAHRGPVGPGAAQVAGLAGGQVDLGAGGAAQLRERFVEALGAELVAGAVACLALNAVPPALVCVVDDGGGLPRLESQGVALRRDDLLQVVPVGHLDDVPVVEVEELARVPLHVVAGDVPHAADAVAVDGRLVPVEVHDHVGEGGGAGRGERFAHAARRQPALALDEVHARRVGAVAVRRADAEADGAGDADAGGARRELDERGRRRRVPVERPGAEGAEQRRRRDGVAPEPEEVLQAQALRQARGQQRRVGHRRHLVAQRPHGVQAHGLVAGRVADEVGVRPVRVAELVVHGVEERGGDEPAR